MRLVWVVDDKIPIHELNFGSPPERLDVELVRHLVDTLPADSWEEPAVLELCSSLCDSDLEPTFFTSPDAMRRTLKKGATPPHAVIFDWEYPASNNEKNCEALGHLLASTFAYVQVYTHLGEGGVEPLLFDLRERHGTRLLPTRMKQDVTPGELAKEISAAWAGTIAGDLADRVRSTVRTAVEHSLIDMCRIPRGAIAAMTEGAVENLVQVVLSRVADEIDTNDGVFQEIVTADRRHEAASEEQRRLMSVWYFFFPADARVRRGDLVELDGALGLIVTPACDLVRFPKKAGRRLTWLRCVRLDEEGFRTLSECGYQLDDFGNSIIASHGGAGDALIVLPNVPRVAGQRDEFDDYVVLCHAWDSRVFEAAPGGSVTYENLDNLQRRCTLAEPFISAVATKVAAIISSPGTPDLPRSELERLRQRLPRRR